MPQLGRVIIEDQVEVGASTTTDRGAGPDTVIGEGTEIDNLVRIGHNVHTARAAVPWWRAAASCAMPRPETTVGGLLANPLKEILHLVAIWNR